MTKQECEYPHSVYFQIKKPYTNKEDIRVFKKIFSKFGEGNNGKQ